MDYTRISADCHIDMPWIPPDLFTANASGALRDRMPYVTDGPDGRAGYRGTAPRSGSSAAWGPRGRSTSRASTTART